jgi:hypothetical protein
VKAKDTCAGRLYSDILATFTRKQHLDAVQVLLCLFLAAMGKPLPTYATVKSPAALSRFLNQYSWSLTAVILVNKMRAVVVSIWRFNERLTKIKVGCCVNIFSRVRI